VLAAGSAMSFPIRAEAGARDCRRQSRSAIGSPIAEQACPTGEIPCMAVDADIVRRIADLARIAVTQEEVGQLEGELNAILAFVEQLSQVDIEGVEPMTSVTPMEMKKRPDIVTEGDIADDIVRNAPATEDHFFMVPKVVE
jgi:aspartyl-tRNA(Asn)/glutamyl-tRNA(Gln) amidotransferase subunit C